jgi:hypothetical protein
LVLPDLNIEMPTDVFHFIWDKIWESDSRTQEIGIARDVKAKTQGSEISLLPKVVCSDGVRSSYVNGGTLLCILLFESTTACYLGRKGALSKVSPDAGIFTNLLALVGLQHQQQ